jgi:triacylglycerol lipase
MSSIPRAHSGDSPWDPQTPSDTIFLVDRASGLDTGCVFRRSGPLRFTVLVDRYVGPTNANGTLKDAAALVAAGVVSAKARLRMPAWDVDYSGAEDPGVSPERDRVTFNGQNFGALTGDTDIWKLNEFDIPIENVKFPSSPAVECSTSNLASCPKPSPARNDIQIDIDTLNTDEEWCTEIDWATLSFEAMAPIILIHGTNSGPDTWGRPDPTFSSFDCSATPAAGSVAARLIQAKVPFDDCLQVEPNGSPANNARQLSTILPRKARRFGVENLHLVTHSKGATDARQFLTSHYAAAQAIDGNTGRPNQFRVLSLYSIGTPSQGTILSSYSIVAADVGDLIVSATGVDVASDPLVLAALNLASVGNGASRTGLAPRDPARAAQTPEAMAAFNVRVRPWPGIRYYSIAGNADANGDLRIEGAERDQFTGFNDTTATIIYRALGRTTSIRVVEKSRGPWGWIKYDFADATLTDTVAPNDLVSTVASTHCATCGFQELATYELNHSTLKNATTVDLIVNRIRQDYPVR